MITQERHDRILCYLKDHNTGSIKELSEICGSSESTVRRDLNVLEENGKLVKVYGGAVLNENRIRTDEPDMNSKHTLHVAEKREIGAYAAGLVKPDDFVFIDAGTTTEEIVKNLNIMNAIYMTNGLSAARILTERGFTVHMVGGTIRARTEAVVGEIALEQIKNCNFSIGFFGTNGITLKNGYTTPNMTEAAFKRAVIKRTHQPFIVADPSKFGSVYPVTFAPIGEAGIITTQLVRKHYATETKIIEVST